MVATSPACFRRGEINEGPTLGGLDHNKKSNFDRLEALCRREGIPLTMQRRVIFTALLKRDDHPTVDQVFAQVKDRILPGVSRTAVYRALETLANLGVCSEPIILQPRPASTATWNSTIISSARPAARLWIFRI